MDIIDKIMVILCCLVVAVLCVAVICPGHVKADDLCCDSLSTSTPIYMDQHLGLMQSSGTVTIQPPVGLPSHAYTSPSGVITIQPPVGLPTQIYPNQMPSSPVTVQPPVGLPSYIYGR